MSLPRPDPAPCLPGGTIRVRVSGLILSLQPSPPEFEGWGIFTAVQERTAELVQEADLPLVLRYLERLPSLRVRLVCPLRGLDTFDNSVGREVVRGACRKQSLPCLHIGLADGYAEVIWDDQYRVPSARQDDVCDYPLARNLVTLAVAVGCEVITAFVSDGSRRSYTITLGDLRVEPFSS